MSREAQCPKCEQWSAVAWQGELPPGGFWWPDTAGCPQCGAIVLVETECKFRRAELEARRSA